VPVTSQWGLGLESVYGTAVTPDHFYECDSEGMQVDQQYIDSQGLRSDTMFTPIGRMRQTTRGAAGDMPCDAPTKGLGAVLNLLHSATVTPTVVTGAAYKQTHPVGNSLPSRSATIQADKKLPDGTSEPFTYPGGILTGATWAMDNGGSLKATFSFDAKDETTPAIGSGASLASASYPSGTGLWASTDTSAVTFNGTQIAVPTALNLAWAQPYNTGLYALGSATKSKPYPNGRPSVTGSVSMLWEVAWYNAFRNNTTVAIVFDFQTPTIIAGSSHEQIKFTVAAAQLRGTSPVVAGEDVISVDVPFTAGFDGTNAPLKIEYVSTDSAL
jgi:hypothetical protein